MSEIYFFKKDTLYISKNVYISDDIYCTKKSVYEVSNISKNIDLDKINGNLIIEGKLFISGVTICDIPKLHIGDNYNNCTCEHFGDYYIKGDVFLNNILSIGDTFKCYNFKNIDVNKILRRIKLENIK
jgi:hypothetical protein